MKRLISVLLAGVISILALGACGADPTATPNTHGNTGPDGALGD